MVADPWKGAFLADATRRRGRLPRRRRRRAHAEPPHARGLGGGRRRLAAEPGVGRLRGRAAGRHRRDGRRDVARRGSRDRRRSSASRSRSSWCWACSRASTGGACGTSRSEPGGCDRRRPGAAAARGAGPGAAQRRRPPPRRPRRAAAGVTPITAGVIGFVVIAAFIAVVVLIRLWMRRPRLDRRTTLEEERWIDRGELSEREVARRRRRGIRLGRRRPPDAVAAYRALLEDLDDAPGRAAGARRDAGRARRAPAGNGLGHARARPARGRLRARAVRRREAERGGGAAGDPTGLDPAPARWPAWPRAPAHGPGGGRQAGRGAAPGEGQAHGGSAATRGHARRGPGRAVALPDRLIADRTTGGLRRAYDGVVARRTRLVGQNAPPCRHTRSPCPHCPRPTSSPSTARSGAPTAAAPAATSTRPSRPYRWIDVAADADIRAMLDAAGYRAIPVVAMPSGPDPGRAQRRRARERHRDRRVSSFVHAIPATRVGCRVARHRRRSGDGPRPPARYRGVDRGRPAHARRPSP